MTHTSAKSNRIYLAVCCMLWCTVQAQHKGLGLPLHHKHTQAHTWDEFKRWQSFIERVCHWCSKSCLCLCLCVCVEPVLFTPCATDTTGYLFKGSEGRREGKRFRRTLSFCWPSDRWVSGGLSSGTGFNQTEWDPAFRDTLCPQHLEPVGGVLHSTALISDHKSSWAGPGWENWQREDQWKTHPDLLIGQNVWNLNRSGQDLEFIHKNKWQISKWLYLRSSVFALLSVQL